MTFKHDNLIFHNIPESDKESTDDSIHTLLEGKLNMVDARGRIKIGRSHTMGRKNLKTNKPRLIVAKFNFYPDKEKILSTAKLLKGTKLAISEQFPQ